MRVFSKWAWAGLVFAAVLAATAPTLAAPPEHSVGVCTVSMEIDPETEESYPVTSCIHTEHQGSGYSPSIDSLYLHITSSRCFYMGTQASRRVFLELEDDGSLTYGWSPNGSLGGHTVIGTASPCSWSRVEREEIEGYVWSEIGDYTHQSPVVSFDPPIPRGMVGIETFAALGTPSPWTYSSTSPYTGSSLSAEVKVRQVRIDWDDGPRQVFSGGDLSRLTGYPDGVASYTYQTKSCSVPGRRCRQEVGAYRIETSFVWSGWYRLAGRRKTLRIPNTSSAADYPVTELIPLVVG